MTSGLLVRLRPAGPWRYGSPAGERRESDVLYRSDSLYSALTTAMASLGDLEPWLDATAKSAAPNVRLTSCFPWMGEMLFVTPPRSVWPAAASKLRAKGAHFVPTTLVSSLLAGKAFDESRWRVDAESGCLLPANRKAIVSPFRSTFRTGAAVDRLTRSHVAPHVTACIEFSRDAGLWAFVSFGDDEAKTRWEEPVKAAFRLLADSGFGGRRSIGWGRAEQPEFHSAPLDEILPVTPKPPPEPKPEPAPAEPVPVEPAPAETTEATPPAEATPPVEAAPREPAEPPVPAKPVYWLLSLYCPTEAETAQLTDGSYTLVTRGGRIQSPQRSGEPKMQLRMVAEGSVITGDEPPIGHAPNVAPNEFPHPVYRYGVALSLPIPAEVTP